MTLKIRELEAKRQAGTDAPLPECLPLSDIVRLEELFQPRREAEHHVTDLREAIKRGATLDPLTVLRVGSTVYLVDGHHRWTAYDEEHVTAPVPVVAFKGTVLEAVRESRRTNAKAKLVMQPAERADAAWRLTMCEGLSLAEIAEDCGVGTATVGRMRRTMRALGDAAFDIETWKQAQRASKGVSDPLGDDEMEEKMRLLAESYTKRIGRTFGRRLTDNIEVTAMALDGYFGRTLPDLVEQLWGYLPEAVQERIRTPPDF
ncbi:ParB N-terminal domain-containing protein [Lichenibacterium ramalinae]|nr:ParB N-terminal domain-containing protein [Lichenibacterium ramalinae]